MNTEILIIEDDDLVRQGIVDILELKGWNAVAAKSCSEALVRIRGEEYMLYVLDMKLPDGNGIMLCRRSADIQTIPFFSYQPMTVKNLS